MGNFSKEKNQVRDDYDQKNYEGLLKPASSVTDSKTKYSAYYFSPEKQISFKSKNFELFAVKSVAMARGTFGCSQNIECASAIHFYLKNQI